VTKSKIRAYFFALLLLAAGVVYVGRSGFHLPGGSDDSHTLVLSASWKLTSPVRLCRHRYRVGRGDQARHGFTARR
jgi:hypothetical protein